jgi:hypothetical protein
VLLSPSGRAGNYRFQVSDFDRAESPLGEILSSGGATLRADSGRVNSIRMVQSLNLLPELDAMNLGEVGD